MEWKSWEVERESTETADYEQISFIIVFKYLSKKFTV